MSTLVNSDAHPRPTTGGHLAALQWLRANNCGWDGGVCMSAVEGSHLELLQWARAHGCQWGGGECYIAVCRYS